MKIRNSHVKLSTSSNDLSANMSPLKIHNLKMKKLVLKYIGLGLALVFLSLAVGQRDLDPFKVQIGLD